MNVAKRPFVDEFLSKLATQYEIGIFTASVKEYAEEVVKRLNVNGAISWTLYRDSCTLYKGKQVKDLKRLPRDLSKTVLVDDSDASFLFQPTNGILCQPFYGSPEDSELQGLQQFLLEAIDVGHGFHHHLGTWNQRKVHIRGYWESLGSAR